MRLTSPSPLCLLFCPFRHTAGMVADASQLFSLQYVTRGLAIKKYENVRRARTMLGPGVPHFRPPDVARRQYYKSRSGRDVRVTGFRAEAHQRSPKTSLHPLTTVAWSSFSKPIVTVRVAQQRSRTTCVSDRSLNVKYNDQHTDMLSVAIRTTRSY